MAEATEPIGRPRLVAGGVERYSRPSRPYRDALRFYQGCGFRLLALRRGAVFKIARPKGLVLDSLPEGAYGNPRRDVREKALAGA
ncbi:MAG: hypothetical protein AAGD12_15220 [Pseudomonadota bacterium]